MAHLVVVLLLAIFCSISPLRAAAQTPNAEERLQQAYAYVAYPIVFDGILVEQLETPIQFRALLYLNLANWNAWCNYHPTAVDIFGRSKFKRPVREHTLENKNTAALYALLRLYESSSQSFGGPSGLPGFRKLMRDRGLDPNDRSLDMTSPVGIGNREGWDTGRLLQIDGWNSEGNLGGFSPGYRLPFFDYTRYVPKNNPWKLSFPFRWQPFLETNGLGFFFRQEHVASFAGSSIAFSMTRKEVRRQRVKSPHRKPWASERNVDTRDVRKLRGLARDVFRTSEKLTVKQRLLAELFDNKVNAFKTKENPLGVASIAASLRFEVLGNALDWNLDDDIIYGLAANIATFDSMMLVWKEKRRQDAVRPTGQTMKYLFGNKWFKAFGGNGKRSRFIRAQDYQPYIRTMPHSEFPSASSCACQALTDHAKIVTEGRDYFPHNITFPKGSSKIYPGEFPNRDVTVPMNRLSAWNHFCGESRLWAGVHFRPAVPSGRRLCSGVGRKAQNVVDRLLAGKPDLTWATWIPKRDRFWERK